MSTEQLRKKIWLAAYDVGVWFLRKTKTVLTWFLIWFFCFSVYEVWVNYFIAIPRVQALGDAVCKAIEAGELERYIKQPIVPYAAPLMGVADKQIEQRREWTFGELRESCKAVVHWGRSDCQWPDHAPDATSQWIRNYFEFASSYSLELWSHSDVMLWNVDLSILFFMTQRLVFPFGTSYPWLFEPSCPAAERMAQKRAAMGIDTTEYLKKFERK